ncbi:insulin-like growth factor-binding protein 2-A isoform X2 [Vanacampus margaritifer]
MLAHIAYCSLVAFLPFAGISLGHLMFRCPSCTAELLDACPDMTSLCAELVREPGCGCCPVCARLEGEPCGVYTPRCTSGLRCHPSADTDAPLQQLLQGLGQCGQQTGTDIPGNQDLQDTNADMLGSEDPKVKAPPLDVWLWQESARKQHLHERQTKMKTSSAFKNACHQELDLFLQEIAKVTSEDNRGALRILYELKLPNCDQRGFYNHKQCNISTNGQRGECWCVNPFTGVEIPATPKVRGDPNCKQLQEEFQATPGATAFC